MKLLKYLDFILSVGKEWVKCNDQILFLESLGVWQSPEYFMDLSIVLESSILSWFNNNITLEICFTKSAHFQCSVWRAQLLLRSSSSCSDLRHELGEHRGSWHRVPSCRKNRRAENSGCHSLRGLIMNIITTRWGETRNGVRGVRGGMAGCQAHKNSGWQR